MFLTYANSITANTHKFVGDTSTNMIPLSRSNWKKLLDPCAFFVLVFSSLSGNGGQKAPLQAYSAVRLSESDPGHRQANTGFAASSESTQLCFLFAICCSADISSSLENTIDF